MEGPNTLSLCVCVLFLGFFSVPCVRIENVCQERKTARSCPVSIFIRNFQSNMMSLDGVSFRRVTPKHRQRFQAQCRYEKGATAVVNRTLLSLRRHTEARDSWFIDARRLYVLSRGLESGIRRGALFAGIIKFLCTDKRHQKSTSIARVWSSSFGRILLFLSLYLEPQLCMMRVLFK